MAKQPYIQFYLGDYIKDTRVLPLNVKGGWVDLILAMWDNNPKGELTGTVDDFSRIMNCSKDEANLVIQMLKQKKFFDYTDLDTSGSIKIVSRKQKKMIELSKKRRDAGNQGGNPNLVNQKDKLNPEYEYINETENIFVLDRGVGKGWNQRPGKEYLEMALDEVKAGAVKVLFKATKNHNLTNDQLKSLWQVFKAQHFTGEKFYQSANDVYSHFINWSKTQNITNGTAHQQPTTTNGKRVTKSSGAEQLIAKLAEEIRIDGTGSESG